MDMAYKIDRHRRFWQPLKKGEGGYLAVTSPIDDSGKPPYALPPPRSLEEQWLSTDYCVQRAEANARNIFWGQDAIQCVFVNFGPGVHAALLGAPYRLQPNSVWFDLDPPIKSWNPAPTFRTDPEHPLYKAIEAHTRALCAASKGRYFVSCTDIGGQIDVLFSLRGEALLADFVLAPEEVLAAQARLDREFVAYFNTLSGIIGPTGCGYTGWIPLVHDKPWYPLQCDLSVMISPAMFEKFVLPSLDWVSSRIGQCVYHLDGPGEIRHLDMLLSLPNIHAIQWVPLPRTKIDDPAYYFQDFADEMSLNVYRRTLAAGRKVVLCGVQPFQVPQIFSAVGCDGVFIQTGCPTRREADDLIALARKEWIR